MNIGEIHLLLQNRESVKNIVKNSMELIPRNYNYNYAGKKMEIRIPISKLFFYKSTHYVNSLSFFSLIIRQLIQAGIV